jgi:hypothetical protein
MEKIEPGMTERPIPLVTRTPSGTEQQPRQRREAEMGRSGEMKNTPHEEADRGQDEDAILPEDENDKGKHVDIKV